MEDPDDIVDEDEKPAMRHVLELDDVIGMRRLTALSRTLVGIDDVIYRFVHALDDPTIALHEVFAHEVEQLEASIVIHRLDRVVTFRWHVEPPIWPGFVFAVDEETNRILVDFGMRRWTYANHKVWLNARGLVDRPYYGREQDALNRAIGGYTNVHEPVPVFHYEKGGYRRKWLEGKPELEPGLK